MKTTQKWNKVFLTGMLAMVLVFGSVLAGCKTDSDDGNDGGGSSGGGVGKPAKLESTATYQQALDKCDEIIAYCDSRAGTGNNAIKTDTQNKRTSMTTTGAGFWSTMKTSILSGLNTNIDNLQ